MFFILINKFKKNGTYVAKQIYHEASTKNWIEYLNLLDFVMIIKSAHVLTLHDNTYLSPAMLPIESRVLVDI